MKMSKELMDKARDILNDQDELYSWVICAEVLASMMENEEYFKFSPIANKSFLDECVKKFNEQLEEGNTVTAADIFESLGFERESAPDFEFKPSEKASKSKKSVKPVYKTYNDLAYISGMEATRCHMLIDKLKATINLLDAQQEYYEVMSTIERDNETFGFDLSI